MSKNVRALLVELKMQPRGPEAEEELRRATLVVASTLQQQTMEGVSSPELDKQLTAFHAARNKVEALLPAFKVTLPPVDRQAVIDLCEAMITK